MDLLCVPQSKFILISEKTSILDTTVSDLASVFSAAELMGELHLAQLSKLFLALIFSKVIDLEEAEDDEEDKPLKVLVLDPEDEAIVLK